MAAFVTFVIGALGLILFMGGGLNLALFLSVGESTGLPHPFVSACMLIAGAFLLYLFHKRQLKDKEAATPEKEVFVLARSATDEALVKLARIAAEAVRTNDFDTFGTIRSALKTHVDIRRFTDVIRTHLSMTEQKAILNVLRRPETIKKDEVKGSHADIAADLSNLKSQISKLPEQHAHIGMSSGPGASTAEQQIPIICLNIEQALDALKTGIDPNGNPISREQIADGLVALVDATKRPGFSGLLNAVLTIEGVTKLEDYMDQLRLVANQLRL